MSPATKLPASSKPLPWPVVAGAVVAIVGLMGLLTLYLPALHAARQGNVVHVQDLTLRLSAQPDQAYQHGVDLELTVDPSLNGAASVELLPSMPSMGNMRAQTFGVQRLPSGVYRSTADLGMGGLWDVQVLVRRPGRQDAVAHFRLNA